MEANLPQPSDPQPQKVIPTADLHFCVITPTHNRREYLEEAIASVQASVAVPINFTFEHLICENGCTDDTREYLARISSQATTMVRFWSQPEKLLPGPARNSIMKYAPEHAWIMPLDDDDVILQRTLYHWAYLIENNPGKQFFVSDFLRMDQDRRYMHAEDYYAWRYPSSKEMLGAIFRGDHFLQGNVCYSKKLYDEVGGYNEQLKMAEDLDLYIRFLLKGHLPVVSPHISHLHRFHTSNFSIGVDAARHKNDLKTLYDLHKDELEELGIDRPK